MEIKMNTYLRLKAHLEKHMYKRGANKGHAPAIASSRWKTQLRVEHLKDEDCMAIKLWRTYIVKAYPDGRMVIDTDGWFNVQPTKHNLSIMLRTFCGWGWGDVPRNMSKFGHKQPTVRVNGVTMRYYDGMEFMETSSYVWELISRRIPFDAKRINKSMTAEFNKAITDSGFKAMFKVIHGACPMEKGPYVTTHPTHLERLVTNPDRAGEWMELIQYLSVEQGWFRGDDGKYTSGTRKKDAKTVWAHITRRVKADMYDVAPTNVYEF
jgi:hypothetical protein